MKILQNLNFKNKKRTNWDNIRNGIEILNWEERLEEKDWPGPYPG